jgi:hypothetical protein
MHGIPRSNSRKDPEVRIVDREAAHS